MKPIYETDSYPHQVKIILYLGELNFSCHFCRCNTQLNAFNDFFDYPPTTFTHFHRLIPTPLRYLPVLRTPMNFAPLYRGLSKPAQNLVVWATLIWIVVAWLFPASAISQQSSSDRTNTHLTAFGMSDISFQRILVEQGLSQANIYAITQDRTGFIWIATADGLNRYDGATFKIYRRIAGDKTSLSDDFVVSLLVDGKGTLWAGTRDGGINRFHEASGTFSHFKHEPKNPQSLANSHATTITEDKQGQLWIGTDNGLSRFDAARGTFANFLPGITVTALCSDKSINAAGMLWVGTTTGLLHFNPANGAVAEAFRRNTHQSSFPQSSSLPTLSLSGDDISCVFQEPSGNVWIGTDTHGLNVYSPKTRSITRFPLETASQHGLWSDNITVITSDAEQHIWIGTQGEGVYVFDPERRKFTGYLYDPANPRSLSGNIIFALFQDRTGAFWIGTFGTGLNVCSASSRMFRGYVCDAEHPSNIRANAVYAICEDKRGTLWFGTEDGLVRVVRETGAITRFPSLSQRNTLSGSGSIFVHGIIEHSSGILFLATDAGLFSLDPVTMRFTSYPVPTEKLIAAHTEPKSVVNNLNNLFTLTEGRNGALWIGSLGGGVHVFDPVKRVFTAHFTTSNSGISHNIVRSIREDKSGHIWIGTRGGGLSRFTPLHTNTVSNTALNGTWKVFRHNEDNPKSLSHDAIFCIYVDANNVVWIGTQGGGLCRFDAASETFMAWKEEQGLANNVIYGIVEDDAHGLWMSTHQGLARFLPNSPAMSKFRAYDWRDGLQNNEFNAGAFSKGRNGRLYFGSIQGVNEFYADGIRENPFIPPVVLTSFKRFGEEVRLERDISLLDTLRISYKDNFFSFEFAALSFVQSNENRFKYMLEGLDAKWIQAGTRHEVRYTNLAGGEYVFRVKASNNDGVWNTEGRTLRIIVTPPFWERWWFRVLVVALGGAVLFLGYRARVRLLKRRTHDLENEVTKRTAELRESYEQLQSANEEIQRQVELLDEQSRETEIANTMLQEKNLEIEQERKKADELLLNVLPPMIAERLKAGESPIAEQFDNVSVLFADIVGFTELASTRSADEVVDMLNTIFSAFDIFSERYNLEKIKTIGDAYMIVGGVPCPHPNHAEAVADMALEMLQTLEILRYTMKADVEVRIGINSGPVVAGIIGQKKFSYDLWGDTVNMASRMESHGEAGKIHCTEVMYHLLKDTFEFEERGEIDIKGKGMMKTYFLIGRRK